MTLKACSTLASDFLNRIGLRSVAVVAGPTPPVSLAEFLPSSHFLCPCQHLLGSPPQVTAPAGVLQRTRRQVPTSTHAIALRGMREQLLEPFAKSETGATSLSYRGQFWGSPMSLGVPLAAISCPGSSELIGNPSGGIRGTRVGGERSV